MLKVPIVTQTRQGICYILPSGLYCKNYIDFLVNNNIAHRIAGRCVSLFPMRCFYINNGGKSQGLNLMCCAMIIP